MNETTARAEIAKLKDFYSSHERAYQEAPKDTKHTVLDRLDKRAGGAERKLNRNIEKFARFFGKNID